MNVLAIRNTSLTQFNGVPTTSTPILGSKNLTNVNVTASSAFQNGWAQLTFTGNGATALGMGATATSNRIALDSTLLAPVTATGVVTFFGLPVTGFMVRNFKNGSLTCPTAGTSTTTCQGNYGSLFNHSYRNNIVP